MLVQVAPRGQQFGPHRVWGDVQELPVEEADALAAVEPVEPDACQLPRSPGCGPLSTPFMAVGQVGPGRSETPENDRVWLGPSSIEKSIARPVNAPVTGRGVPPDGVKVACSRDPSEPGENASAPSRDVGAEGPATVSACKESMQEGCAAANDGESAKVALPAPARRSASRRDRRSARLRVQESNRFASIHPSELDIRTSLHDEPELDWPHVGTSATTGIDETVITHSPRSAGLGSVRTSAPSHGRPRPGRANASSEPSALHVEGLSQRIELPAMSRGAISNSSMVSPTKG